MNLQTCVLSTFASLVLLSSVRAADHEFVVWSAESGFSKPSIILQFDPKSDAEFDWDRCQGKQWFDQSDEALLGSVVEFLREGVERMTGQRLPVESSNDLSHGIVLTLFDNADAAVRNDAAIREALKNDGGDAYNDREAFYLRSETDRLLVVANTAQGLACAIPTLLESVGYEVLGMGHTGFIRLATGGSGLPSASSLPIGRVTTFVDSEQRAGSRTASGRSETPACLVIRRTKRSSPVTGAGNSAAA